MPDLTKELTIAEALAREAGRAVRRLFEQGTAVAWKGVNDPVTAADHAANEILLSGLTAAFPDDGFLSEETADNRSRLDRRRVWLIDPLDGTREFIDGIPEFSIMVGLAIAGRPALGVVYQPIADLLYRGAPDIVAEVVCRDEIAPLAVSAVREPAAMRLVVSRSHRNPLVNDVRRRLGIQQERPSGSVGLKVGLLATGQCDLYIHPAPGLKEWDTCAPEAILQAAGGMVTDGWGRPLQYNKLDVRQRQGLLASNGVAHDQIVAAVTAASHTAGFRLESGYW
ncbi:MAG: 3'(2'),5'-bisphosphate nucleotidase CysQ [Caldilineales bacterium]|nr:3'(2'),5'-bisphosphate nucleotidase CysQ [Caldilineales bacterium]MDW8318206.1 3'(2'),5'-bisphosphate nucleotidase CysQ [Anaerolineae bacterium]